MWYKCKGVNKLLYSIGRKKVGEISKEGACVVRENGSHKLMLQLKFWQQFRTQAPDHFSRQIFQLSSLVKSPSLVVHRSYLGIVYT